MGNVIVQFCLDVLNKGKSMDSINNTYIILIPKVNNPIKITEFRPINLYTVIYKMMAKAIVNGLQKAIGVCIDEAQCAFIPDYLISNNILIAYGILHAFKNRRTDNSSFMRLKLDMSKTYDRVEQGFLENLMIQHEVHYFILIFG